MKTTGIILIIFGVLNIFRGIATLKEATSEYQSQGFIYILLGIGLVLGGWFAFSRIKKDKQEKKDFDE